MLSELIISKTGHEKRILHQNWSIFICLICDFRRPVRTKSENGQSSSFTKFSKPLDASGINDFV